MKGSISYLPEEEARAQAWAASIKAIEPGLKVRKSDARPPYKHLYFTTKKTNVMLKNVETQNLTKPDIEAAKLLHKTSG
jgi:hypothetical protein